MDVDIHTDQILWVSTPPPINALRKKPTRHLRALVLLLASFITIGAGCVDGCVDALDRYSTDQYYTSVAHTFNQTHRELLRLR